MVCLLSTKEQALAAAESAASKKAQDITILDLEGISLVADYFIIVSGRSDVQVRAIAQAIEERMEEEGMVLKQKEGFSEARWVLLDYADLVIHIFHEETREYYQLERLWADAGKIMYQ